MPPAMSCLSAESVPPHAERSCELRERGLIRGGDLRTPRVLQDGPDEPIRAGDESIDGGVIRIDEQVGEPRVIAAEGEGISVEEHDARDPARVFERGGSCDAGAERVTNEGPADDVETLFEALHELEPVVHGVRAPALAVAERRQVEREYPMAGSRNERNDVMPDPGWLGGPAEEHHRRAVLAPSAIGQCRPVDPDERAAIEATRRRSLPLLARSKTTAASVMSATRPSRPNPSRIPVRSLLGQGTGLTAPAAGTVT